ncbi:hypothetical protein [Psychrobium sp. 1_MG-2023]|uniref:hypothetical protein n=1 Tax=Psychrobium sp. 1_MG-2023 TaxID=3062624 RepID=UPI000C334466|nr:hypothetical protein [Psychrobium sp. 1_MG-2023]MDP2560107.1 hypothetical protein [Psychrobium sp. 1_MG-2023]PKF56923.1 hypothetical protein CW748_07445 [Alteromonadales bacterium alter-6D02]
MKNCDRKVKILRILASDKFDNYYDAFSKVGGDVNTLEAIPFGSRNETIRIAEDLADGVISNAEAISRLIKLVQSVPD